MQSGNTVTKTGATAGLAGSACSKNTAGQASSDTQASGFSLTRPRTLLSPYLSTRMIRAAFHAQ